MSKLRVNALCAGNSPVVGEFPAQKRPVTRKNDSIWWRHREDLSFPALVRKSWIRPIGHTLHTGSQISLDMCPCWIKLMPPRCDHRIIPTLFPCQILDKFQKNSICISGMIQIYITWGILYIITGNYLNVLNFVGRFWLNVVFPFPFRILNVKWHAKSLLNGNDWVLSEYAELFRRVLTTRPICDYTLMYHKCGMLMPFIHT